MSACLPASKTENKTTTKILNESKRIETYLPSVATFIAVSKRCHRFISTSCLSLGHI